MNINASGRSALIVAAAIWIWCSGPLHAQETTSSVQAAPAATQQPQQPNALQQLFGIKPTPVAAEPPAPAEVGKPVALNKYTRHRSHHRKRYSSSRSHKRESVAKNRSKATEQTDESKIVDADTGDLSTTGAKTTPPPPALSASVANAKAQLIDRDASSNGAATTTPAQNASPTQPETAAAQVAAGTTEASNTGTGETNVVPSDELNEVDRALSEKPEPTPTLALASLNAPAPTTGQAASAGDDSSSWAQASLIGKIFIAFGGLLTLASAARMLIA